MPSEANGEFRNTQRRRLSEARNPEERGRRTAKSGKLRNGARKSIINYNGTMDTTACFRSAVVPLWFIYFGVSAFKNLQIVHVDKTFAGRVCLERTAREPRIFRTSCQESGESNQSGLLNPRNGLGEPHNRRSCCALPCIVRKCLAGTDLAVPHPVPGLPWAKKTFGPC